MGGQGTAAWTQPWGAVSDHMGQAVPLHMGMLQRGLSSLRRTGGQHGALGVEFLTHMCPYGIHSWWGQGAFTMQSPYIKNMFFKAHFEAYPYKSNPVERH